MTDDRRARFERIVEAIRRYLAAHPLAADTEIGIAEWWLPEHGVDGAVTEVREALVLLERDGVVEACRLEDGRSVWRRTTGRQQE